MQIPIAGNRFGGSYLPIGENFLSLHINVCGNPGMGKSTFMMHVLDEVERRGEVAIVLGDPKQEFFKRFFRRHRANFNGRIVSDIVIDPSSDDCSYWASEEECIDRARAETWGKSFIPDPPGQDENFFPRNARAALAGIMARHNIWNMPHDPATCENLSRWIGAAETELMKRLAKIPGTTAFNPKAQEQLAGLTGTMAPLAPSFGLMPRREEGRPKFTVREWEATRDGSWIFFTSTPETRDASRPVQSAIADNLLRALEKQRPGSRRVWIVADELSLMKRMPSLIEAAAMLRAAGNPLVMGYQNSAQIELLYGQAGMRALLGMAYTQICFATTDDAIQAHMEKQFGSAEIERVSKNEPAHLMVGSKHARSASLTSQQIAKDPIIMDSQFGGLSPHTFAIKIMDMVRVETIQRNERQEFNEYRERVIPEMPVPPAPVEEEIVPCDEPEELVPCDPPEKKKPGRKKKEDAANLLTNQMALATDEDEGEDERDAD